MGRDVPKLDLLEGIPKALHGRLQRSCVIHGVGIEPQRQKAEVLAHSIQSELEKGYEGRAI